MRSKTERVVTAAAGILIGTAFGGPIGAGVGAAAADYAIQRIGKASDKKSKDGK